MPIEDCARTAAALVIVALGAGGLGAFIMAALLVR